jgi:iron complex transport system substrate-binding protein
MAAGKMRIVSLVPSATDILHRLGAARSLVAVTRWCKDVVPAKVVHGLPTLDDCWSADAAKVAALKPDLVIGGVPYRAEVVNAMLARGLRFLATSPRTLDDIYGDIRTLARIAGKENKGERVIARMQGKIRQSTRKAARTRNKPRVYCEVWPNPLRTCEPWVAEMVEAAGGEFVPQPAGRRVSPEEVVAADPQIIVLAWAATGSRARPDTVRKRPGWKNIAAVRENRIHVVRDEWLNTPSPVLVRGLTALAAIIHAENSQRRSTRTG